MRKRISPELKGKVAIAAIQGHRTVNEITSEYEVLPAQVSTWKKQYLDTASAVFSSTVQQKNEKSTEELISTLYKKIGILEVERDFLKKRRSWVFCSNITFMCRAKACSIEYYSTMHSFIHLPFRILLCR